MSKLNEERKKVNKLEEDISGLRIEIERKKTEIATISNERDRTIDMIKMP